MKSKIINQRSAIASEPQRILLIRLSSLGDVVLTTPAIRAVRRAFPAAHISMIVGARSADSVRYSPWLDEVIPFDRKGKGCNTSEMRRVMGCLQSEPFDLSVDFQRKLRSALLAWSSGARQRVGYHEPGGFLCTLRVPEPDCGHAIERNLGLLEAVGIPADGLAPEVYLSPEAETFARITLPEISSPRLGLFPGAGWNLREWMSDRFATVADRAAGIYGAEVVIFGGSAERTLAGDIAAQMKHPATVLAGSLTVAQLAALIARCDLFISNDTGPMHISVGVGTSTVALFGPGNHEKFGPLGDTHTLIRHTLPCSPCKQFTDHCKSNICMQQITIDEVWGAVQKRWDERNRVTVR